MEERTPSSPVRVAVVGSGLAGLVTAYLLQTLDFYTTDGLKVVFQVHLFEKSDSLGMDSSSVTVKTDTGAFRVDSPMRSINGGSHGRVWKLYSFLGVHLRMANFSYSFSRLSTAAEALPPPYDEVTTPPSPPPPCFATPTEKGEHGEPTQTPMFIYEGSNGLKWPPLSFPSRVSSMPACGRHLLYLFLLSLSYLHLLVLAFFYHYSGLTATTRRRNRKSELLTWLGIANLGSEPLGQWCERHYVWKVMREEVLEPLVAAVATVGRDEVCDLPVGDILEYITSTFGSSHYVASSGVQEVVSLLSAPLPLSQIHLSSPLTSITPSPCGGNRLHFTAPLPHADFQYVVLATQANHAKSLLALYGSSSKSCSSEKSSAQRLAALGAFKYARSLVVTHTDEGILPTHEEDRRDLNLASFSSPFPSIPPSPDLLPPTCVQATHIIARTHPSLSPSCSILQTTNPIVPIDPTKILSSTWFERVVVTPTSRAVLSQFIGDEAGEASLQGRDGIWFTGSYCAEGIPLLEGCVSSAERAIQGICQREALHTTIPF